MKNKRVWPRFMAGAAAVFAAPFLVTAMIRNPPDLSGVVSAAVKFTGTGVFTKSEIDGFGSGSMILYTPKKPAATEAQETEAQTEPPQTTETTAAEVSEEITEEITEESLLITQNISEETEDLSIYGNYSGKVTAMTYTPNGGANFLNLPGGGQVRNCTELDNNYLLRQISTSTSLRIEAGTEQPQVLIMHTHTSESYLPGGEYYDKEYPGRTCDPTQSVVAVGERIAIKLAEAGICTIHDGTVHDAPLYNGSYDRAEETVAAILQKYPSIKVVLDVHRDGIIQDDGTWVSAVNEINGKEAAQVMIISAADGGGYKVPDYIEKLRFACLLQDGMEKDNPGITRPVLLEYCQYNQHLSVGSLLIEVGSQGNTLEQALYTGDLIGESIARSLLSLS